MCVVAFDESRTVPAVALRFAARRTPHSVRRAARRIANAARKCARHDESWRAHFI